MTRAGVPVEGAAGVGVAMSKFAVPRRRPDIVRRPRLNSLVDAHLLQPSEDVMATLGFLLERAPENLHIVMTSRTRPPIPSLARLIARRDVATIGAADLAFTGREIRELLGTMGRAVSEDEAESLFERTEGWAAALILGAGPDGGLPSGR